jgi:hypothetical protein
MMDAAAQRAALDEQIATLARAYRGHMEAIGLLQEAMSDCMAAFDRVAPVGYIAQVDGILVRKSQGPNDPVPKLLLNGESPADRKKGNQPWPD